MVMRRVRQPAEALMKLAVEQPKTATPKKRKNIETNVLGYVWCATMLPTVRLHLSLQYI